MTETPTYDRAVRIAKAIARMIQKDGGTPSHVAAVTVGLPASTFDQIKRESPGHRHADGEIMFRIGVSDKFSNYLVAFERGDDNLTIINRNLAWLGKPLLPR
ncbi:hypothetical protein [Bradyrhizobium sp. UNPA324]|uniref:hypothetical protein n=1 Tax=Bradyrhizobium sp. UNPA324 TaxID=1141174 RepID=UPI00114D78D7|nr:hypothetical protein [Bradyrhizobium sp. UNPA324]TQF28870.1 hypothetical protein UNPA324_03815 [Bradyrhizobium sp. UNPA324]